MNRRVLLPICFVCGIALCVGWYARQYHESNASAGEVIVDLQSADHGPRHIVFLSNNRQSSDKWTIVIPLQDSITVLEDQEPSGWRTWLYRVQGGQVQRTTSSDEARPVGVLLWRVDSRSVPIQRESGDSGSPHYVINTFFYGTQDEFLRYIHEPSRVVPSAYFKDIVEIEGRMRAGHAR